MNLKVDLELKENVEDAFVLLQILCFIVFEFFQIQRFHSILIQIVKTVV